MTDQNGNPTEDAALSAPGYTPPAAVASNTDTAAVAQLVQEAVERAVAQLRATQDAANALAQPKVLTPEEEARKALDNAGAGLGVEERLAELYKHVALLASKVGL